MKTTLTLTIDDLIEAKKLHIHPRRVLAIVFVLLIGLTAVMILCGAYGSLMGDSSDFSWLWAFGIGAYFAIVYHRIVYASAKSQFRQNKKLSEPFELELTESSCITRASHGFSEINYADFHKWRHNDKAILFYHSAQLFQIVPARAFEDNNERNAVLELIREKAGDPK